MKGGEQMSEARKTIRIMPMPVVHPRWENEYSQYPETVKISMSDGKIKTYRLVTEQPKPFIFSDEASKIMERNTFGGYKAKHGKRPDAESNSEPAR